MSTMSRPGRMSAFESIRHEDEDGGECWSARDLAKVLGYAKWDKFKHVIAKAQKACENSAQVVSDHFRQVGKVIEQKHQPSLFDDPSS